MIPPTSLLEAVLTMLKQGLETRRLLGPVRGSAVSGPVDEGAHAIGIGSHLEIIMSRSSDGLIRSRSVTPMKN